MRYQNVDEKIPLRSVLIFKVFSSHEVTLCTDSACTSLRAGMYRFVIIITISSLHLARGLPFFRVHNKGCQFVVSVVSWLHISSVVVTKCPATSTCSFTVVGTSLTLISNPLICFMNASMDLTIQLCTFYINMSVQDVPATTYTLSNFEIRLDLDLTIAYLGELPLKGIAVKHARLWLLAVKFAIYSVSRQRVTSRLISKLDSENDNNDNNDNK